MSNYIQKTQDIWTIQGKYDRITGWEDLTSEDTYKQARQRLKEYNENESGYPHKIVRQRVKIVA